MLATAAKSIVAKNRSGSGGGAAILGLSGAENWFFKILNLAGGWGSNSRSLSLLVDRFVAAVHNINLALWGWCAWVVGRPISITYEYTPFPPLWRLKSTRPAVLGIPAQGTKFSKSMLATAAKNIVAKILVGSGGCGSNFRGLWRSKLVFQNPGRLWGVGL